MAGISRFDCFPSDFLNGVIGLSADQIAAYTVVMMLQYDRGACVAFVGRERELAVRSGMPTGRLRKAVESLCELGKLVKHDDGSVENLRTTREIAKIGEKIARKREIGERGGNVTRQKWEGKGNEINGGIGASALADGLAKQGLYPPSPVPLPKEEAPSELCPKRVRTRKGYSTDFEEFWSAYPTDSNMSKAEAGKAWERMPEADRRDARASLSAFDRYCASHADYRPLHACRYLSQRRWEGHLKTAAAVKERVFIHQDSPQWTAWRDYLKRTGKPSPPINQAGGWYFDSEWPPKLEERAA